MLTLIYAINLQILVRRRYVFLPLKKLELQRMMCNINTVQAVDNKLLVFHTSGFQGLNKYSIFIKENL